MGLAVCAGCSSSKDSGTTPTDAGGDAAPAVATVSDKGVVVDFNSLAGVGGVTIAEGGQTTTTASDGSWSLTVPKDTALTLSLSKGAANASSSTIYVPEDYFETKLGKDTVRESITLVKVDTFNLVTGSFDGYDKNGLLYVEIIALPTCATFKGATLRFATPANEVVRYVKNHLPLASATSVDPAEGEVVALFYNVALDTPLNVIIENTTCTQVPFPYTDDATGTTYTGNVQVHGATSAVARYFVK